ncbi:MULTISPECIES: hypothetical protein [unclassified Pseudonocardia]|uniref:hypothetical protein n=1 Tax=unclassified Pseudonocardia TaxID=2619320 RepID=UPI0001FFDA63|nr:hypothetical protein [Pseudonocardia sp. Ae707_Ps1]OLM09080.1 hypothetical protein Ae707Ps1_6027c [Pseudonocardia sp. Ae707_Ps1]
MTASGSEVDGPAAAAGVRWWGAALPRSGQLVVADPLLATPLLRALLSDAIDGGHTPQRSPRRFPLLLLVIGVVGGCAAVVVVVPDAVQSLLLVLLAVGFAVWACTAQSRTATIRHREGARPLFAIRAAGGPATWALVAHLEDVGGHSEAARGAVRTLLWRVAHLSPTGDPAIATLADLARSGGLHTDDDLHQAAERLQALPAAAPGDVRRTVPQLSTLFRYEARERG